MEKEMNIEKQDITNIFFNYVENIRKNSIYKKIGTTKKDKAKTPKNDLINIMNISDEQRNLQNILKKKRNLISNKNSNNKFLLDNINKKILEIIWIKNFNLIEQIEIKNEFQYTINILKLKWILNKLKKLVNINEIIEKIIKTLIDNNIMQNYEIIKDKNWESNFINFNISNNIASIMLDEIKELIDWRKYISNIKNKEILIDYSSPNVAKQMTVWHLRSTLIWEVLKNLFEKKWHAITLWFNHLWDWWEQFWKIFFTLIYSSDEEIKEFKNEFKKNPNKWLFDIYIKYKQISCNFPNSKEIIKDLNTKLNNWDPNLIGIWKLIRQISINDFDKIYKRLGINFESRLGEAFYEIFMDDVINDLRKYWYLIKDKEWEKIYILKLNKEELRILKKNDTELINHFKESNENIFQKVLRNNEWITNYLTRDIAALKFRKKYIWVEYVIYLTDIWQSEHFKVLECIWKALNYIEINNFQHIWFWLYLKDWKKMSSREWNVEKLSEIFEMVDNILKIDKLSNAAILINDLKQQIHKWVEFNPQALTKSQWDTGIYLLYTIVRIEKILKDNNYKYTKINLEKLPPKYKNILSNIFKYKNILENSLETRRLNLIVEYAFEIAHILNNFYSNWENIKKIKDKEEKQSILQIFWLCIWILKDILWLINIEIPEEM